MEGAKGAEKAACGGTQLVEKMSLEEMEKMKIMKNPTCGLKTGDPKQDVHPDLCYKMCLPVLDDCIDPKKMMSGGMDPKCEKMIAAPEMDACMFCMGCPEAEKIINERFGGMEKMFEFFKKMEEMEKDFCPAGGNGGPLPPCDHMCGEMPCMWCDDAGCCSSQVDSEYCRKENPNAKVKCLGTSVNGGDKKGRSGKAGGDPHLLNIKGEKFNIHRQGYAPLVNINSDGVAHLKVEALIEGVKKCQKK